jgi:hypothetical protein
MLSIFPRDHGPRRETVIMDGVATFLPELGVIRCANTLLTDHASLADERGHGGPHNSLVLFQIGEQLLEVLSLAQRVEVDVLLHVGGVFESLGDRLP